MKHKVCGDYLYWLWLVCYNNKNSFTFLLTLYSFLCSIYYWLLISIQKREKKPSQVSVSMGTRAASFLSSSSRLVAMFPGIDWGSFCVGHVARVFLSLVAPHLSQRVLKNGQYSTHTFRHSIGISRHVYDLMIHTNFREHGWVIAASCRSENAYFYSCAMTTWDVKGTFKYLSYFQLTSVDPRIPAAERDRTANGVTCAHKKSITRISSFLLLQLWSFWKEFHCFALWIEIIFIGPQHWPENTRKIETFWKWK